MAMQDSNAIWLNLFSMSLLLFGTYQTQFSFRKRENNLVYGFS